MNELEIPKACENCPHLCEIERELAFVDKHKEMVTDFATSDEVPELLKEALVQAGGMSEEFADSVASDGIAKLRSDAAAELDDADNASDMIVDVARALVAVCPGMLKMRAKTKAGRLITVGVCGSDFPPAGRHHEGVHVERGARGIQTV